MSDINTIKSKLDTDNQKGVISEKEFNDNFGKLDQTDYKKISEGLEAKDQQFLNLLQKPIFENIQKKDLLNKQSLSVNEIKTVKLFFMSYGMNANRSGEREKSNDQKMAEMYMNQKQIWYGLGQDGWNEFKKGFKGNMFNFNKSKGKDISYPAGPINMNHPDIKRLNGEQLQITQQIEKVQKDNYNKIQKSMKDIENKEIATKPLSKKLEELKNGNTLDALDELTSVPNGILYNDNIKEMTYNEQQKIQKIIENVFSNPSVNSTQAMDYVWKFHCSLSDEKRSNKTGEKSSLGVSINNQVGMRIEIINTCYQLAQAKGFGELQSKPETAKRSLVKLCNILTGRFNSTGRGRMMQEDNDKKFNNPELARGILESLMQINGTIDKISPVDVLKDEPSLKNKECGDFVAEISQNIPRPLSGEFGILDLVSVDEKTKISQLSATLQARVIVLKKISEKIKSDKKQIPFDDKYIQELKNLGTNEAKAQQTKFETQKENFKEEIEKVDFWTSGFEKSAQEYGLQGADTDIFNLYRDFAVNSFWAGQLSDEVDDQIMGYAKMGAMIGGTIVTMMIFPPAGVGYLGSAIAVGVTSTVLTQMLYKKMDYNSFSEGVVDIGSQFVFDTATAFLGMKVFGPIIQKAPGFFNNVKNITSNVGITLFDVTIGSTAEGIRQIGYNELFDKQENVDILQMIRAGGVMATVFLMVSGGFHVKLPVDDMLRHLRANDPTLNPTGFKNLKISEIDYQNSIKLLEVKSKALAERNTSSKQKADQTNQKQADIEQTNKNKVKEDFNTEKQKFENMTSEQILEYAKENYNPILEKYKQKMGDVVNADDFRDYVGGRVGIDSNKTHEAASYLADRYFEELLIQNKGKGNNTVKFLAGGPGSGKSSIDDLSPNNDYSAVLDGTFKTYKNAEKNIEKAIELGYNVRVEFVYRDINEAFVNGVLKRTISQNKRMYDLYGVEGLGRTVPMNIYDQGHNGARETVVRLYEKYGPNVVKFFGGGDVDMPIGNGIVNKVQTSKGQPPYVYQYDIDYIKSQMQGNQHNIEKSKFAIEEARLKGEITETQNNNLLGSYK